MLFVIHHLKLSQCGISRSTVIRTTKRLVEFGLIKREQRTIENEHTKCKGKFIISIRF